MFPANRRFQSNGRNNDADENSSLVPYSAGNHGAQSTSRSLLPISNDLPRKSWKGTSLNKYDQSSVGTSFAASNLPGYFSTNKNFSLLPSGNLKREEKGHPFLQSGLGKNVQSNNPHLLGSELFKKTFSNNGAGSLAIMRNAPSNLPGSSSQNKDHNLFSWGLKREEKGYPFSGSGLGTKTQSKDPHLLGSTWLSKNTSNDHASSLGPNFYDQLNSSHFYCSDKTNNLPSESLKPEEKVRLFLESGLGANMQSNDSHSLGSTQSSEKASSNKCTSSVGTTNVASNLPGPFSPNKNDGSLSEDDKLEEKGLGTSVPRKKGRSVVNWFRKKVFK